MMFFLIDILVYNLTSSYSFLILLNLNRKTKYIKLVILSIILDYIIFDTYYKWICIISILLLINKYVFRYKIENIVNFLSINILNYCLFLILNSFINYNFSFYKISNLIINNFFLYIIISIIYYYKCINKD